MPRRPASRARHGIVLLPLVLAAGCAQASTLPLSTPAPTAAAPAATPVDVDNCGTVISPGDTPDRIVTVKSTTTELLVELGLADRIVGAAFLDGPIEAPYTATDVQIPVISDFLPGPEATLALEPDAVVGGWESNFAADGVGERAALADLDILTYVAPSACKEAGYMPDPMTFDVLWEEIAEAGAGIGAPEMMMEAAEIGRASCRERV